MTTAWIVLGYASGVIGLLLAIGIGNALIEWLRAVATHRHAQASSVLHHAGLLETEETS